MPIVIEIPEIAPLNALPFLVVCGFALFDVLVGLCKAFATHSYDSSKMRAGLWHKSALVAVTILAYAVEAATGLMDFSAIGWEQGATVPFVGVVCAYIVVMEVGSILESIVAINPELGGSRILGAFGKFARRDPDATTVLPAIDGDEG